MSDNKKGAGRKMSMDYNKISKVFDTYLKLHGSKKYLCKKLNICEATLFNFTKNAKTYIDKYSDLLEESGFFDVTESSLFEEVFDEDIIYTKEHEFKQKYGIEPCASIPPTLSRIYSEWLKEEKISYVEKNIFAAQKEILEKISFEDSDLKNYNIRITLMMYYTLERADCVLTESYCDNLSNAIKDPKNVKIVENRLKKKDKDEFQEEAPAQQITHNHNVSFIQQCLEAERISGMNNLLSDDSEIIEGEIEE